MRGWWGVTIAIVAVAALAACGRSGFTDSDGGDLGPPDYVPDPIDWPDFSRLSSAAKFTGITRPVDIEIQATYGQGMPTVEARVDSGEWVAVTPTASAIVQVPPNGALQFRVLGNVGESAILTITNASSFDALLDTTKGTATSNVTGTGSSASPFVAPAPTPKSCAEFLAGFPEQVAKDGVYSVDPGTPFDAFCDMTTDGGGWTLIARVLGTDTTHTTANAIGTLTDPTQTSLAKLADAHINTLGFAHMRIDIEGVSSVYAKISTISFAPVNGSTPNTAAKALAGPYSYTFGTQVTCSSDCGVAHAIENMGFGPHCGYRFYSSAGNPRPGMGCQGNVGHNGTAWVQ